MHDFLGQPQLQSQQTHLVLEQAFQRLDQFESQVFRKPAHVVVALDHGRRVARDGYRLDHIRIQRALGEKFCFPGALSGRLEHLDKGLADDLSFAFRVGHAL